MAKRVQATAAKHPAGENPLAERWWQTPTVSAAIMALAALLVAIIGLGTPKSKPSAPVHIEQQTHGPNSPAVGQTGGDVTINQQQESGQKP